MAKRFWIYTHNFTHSGAPLVMASIARELAAAGWREQLRVVSWGGLHDRRHSTLQHELAVEGIHCQVLDLHQRPPRIQRRDRLLLNSLALPEAVVCQALDWLWDGKLSRLDWYCHEGNPEAFFSGQKWPEDINQALKTERFRMRVPSLKTFQVYTNWLHYTGSGLDVQTPQILVPEHLIASACSDFSSLKIQLTGSVGFGQKGHLWILQLLERVLSQYPQATKALRPIRLEFIGIETGPYAALARKVCSYGVNLLGENFSWSPQDSHENTLRTMAKSNLSISCSQDETFSLVSAESMALGQPILRNETGGFDEQLNCGDCGFSLGPPSPYVSSLCVQLLGSLRDPQTHSEQSFLDKRKQALNRYACFASSNIINWLI